MVDRHHYAGFWRRFGSFLIDMLVYFPFLFLNYRLCTRSHSIIIPITSYILVAILIQSYTIYCHGKWGRTIGKLATGIKIVSLEFEPIGWRRAFKRSSVDILFGISACYGFCIATMCFSDAGLGTDGMMRFNGLEAWYPPWQKYSNWASQLWVFSEFVVMMTNDRRRALHDFIAGTVVIQVRGLEKRKWDKDDPFLRDYSKDLKRFNKLMNPF